MCLCHDSDLLLLQFLPRLLLLLSLHELKVRTNTGWLVGRIMLVCSGYAVSLLVFLPSCLECKCPNGPVMARTFIVIILLERAFLCGTSAIVFVFFLLCRWEKWLKCGAKQRRKENERMTFNGQTFLQKSKATQGSHFWRGQHKHRKKEKRKKSSHSLHTGFFQFRWHQTLPPIPLHNHNIIRHGRPSQ